MSWVELLGAPELWMALSLLAALLPGPQTRVLPAVLQAVARALGARARAPESIEREAGRGRER